MRSCWLAAAWLLIAAPVRAQLFTPQGEKIFSEALTSLYNLNYDESRVYSQNLIALEPDNPFSYLAESGMIWWQSSCEYGLFKDTPTLEDRFESDISNAIDKGETALATAEDKNDVEGQAKAHFVIGMALGTRGEWKLLRRHYLGAYFDGKHAVEHLDECLSLDPNFYDADIGLGLYDYMTDHLPRVLKLSTLFFIHGNAKRGLERLEIAYERGHYTPSYAAQYLASIYIVDQHDDAKAMPMIQYLRSRYPQSPYFQLLDVSTLIRMGNPAALDKAKALAAQVQDDPAFFGRKQLSFWCGLYGEDCFSPHGLQVAGVWLSDAIAKSGDAPPTFWLKLLHFYRGVVHDLLGHRDSAMEDYGYVIVGPKFGAINTLAQHCLENPCDRQEVRQQLKMMSLQPVGNPQEPTPKKSTNNEAPRPFSEYNKP